jgi:hypothetical protein
MKIFKKVVDMLSRIFYTTEYESINGCGIKKPFFGCTHAGKKW